MIEPIVDNYLFETQYKPGYDKGGYLYREPHDTLSIATKKLLFWQAPLPPLRNIYIYWYFAQPILVSNRF